MSRVAALFGSEELSPDNPTPLYLRIQERISRAIRQGRLRPLDALPGERDIAEAFAVSRVTVRKALAELVKSGLLVQRQGSGTFVASPPRKVEQALSRLTSFTEDMHLRGFSSASRWIKREMSLASPQEAMRLSLSPTDMVCRLSRLRLADAVPMAIERATIAARYLPDPELVGQSLYAFLEKQGVRPVRALQRLSAANLLPEDAELLDMAPGAAALSIDRLAFLENGTPIEFTHSWYRGDAYDFVAELTLRRE